MKLETNAINGKNANNILKETEYSKAIYAWPWTAIWQFDQSQWDIFSLVRKRSISNSAVHTERYGWTGIWQEKTWKLYENKRKMHEKNKKKGKGKIVWKKFESIFFGQKMYHFSMINDT